MHEQPLLEVTHLTVRYAHRSPYSPAAVDDMTFSIAPGETVGLTGASGCGKTTTALAIAGLLPRHARVSGSIWFRGHNLTRLSERELRAIRGVEISIIFQEPALALNPVMAVGQQIVEVVRAHIRCSWEAARQRALAAMADVGLGNQLPRLYDAYPHELSGGQAQRVVIAQALVCSPALVIADEPTASVDATVRAEILCLIRQLRERHRTAFLLISHNPDVLASAADRVIEMSGGKLMGSRVASRGAPFPRLPRAEKDPLAAVERTDVAPPMTARGVTKVYHRRRLFSRQDVSVPAFLDVDLSVPGGTIFGIIGESGAGKSTLARCLAGLDTVDVGEVRIGGHDIARLRGRELRPYRSHVQLILQDSASALNPRFTAEEIVAEPLVIQGIGTRRERRHHALELMAGVGLAAARASSRPWEFSGGERQRLAIARALAVRPRVLVFDESFSGFDREHREQIIDLLHDLRQRYRLTYVCISHDLSLIAAFTSNLAVMYRGRIVEHGSTFSVLNAPQHAHTRALVSAACFAPEAISELAG